MKHLVTDMYLFVSLTLRKKIEKNFNSYQLCSFSAPNLLDNKLLLLALIPIFLLSGCMTVPIQNRNLSEAGGFWEQDENTDPRFKHDAITGNETIGVLYASGKNALVNGSSVEGSAEISNNAFVSTGSQSSARIEFKKGDAICLIRIEDFSTGNSYGDTSNCQHNIVTKHAGSETKNSAYHISVSQLQTEFTVLRGSVKLMLLSNSNQSIVVSSGEEAILTADSIIGPHSVPQDEIERRIRWRDNYNFSRTQVDWTKVLIGVGAVGAAAATAIILHKSGGGGNSSGGGSTIGGDKRSTDKIYPDIIDSKEIIRESPLRHSAPKTAPY